MLGWRDNARMRLELFPFRYRDPLTGKWVRARYRAERHEIAARYVEWEITGPAEVRDVDPQARRFTPHCTFKVDGCRVAPVQRAPARAATRNQRGRSVPARGIPPPVRYLLRQAWQVRRDEGAARLFIDAVRKTG